VRRDCVENSNKNRFQSLCSPKTFSGSSQPIHCESAMPRIVDMTSNELERAITSRKHCGQLVYNRCLLTFLSSNLRGDLQSASRNIVHQFFVNINFSHRRSWSYADGTQHEIIDQDLEVKGAIEVCKRTSLRALPLIRTAVEI
jgi:hypothetical protein